MATITTAAAPPTAPPMTPALEDFDEVAAATLGAALVEEEDDEVDVLEVLDAEDEGGEVTARVVVGAGLFVANAPTPVAMKVGVGVGVPETAFAADMRISN